MKFSIFKRNNKSKHLMRRGLALLLAFATSATMTLPNHIESRAAEISPVAEDGNGLIAYFTFDDSTVTNLVGNDVMAKIEGDTGEFSNYADDPDNYYLDLTNNNAYLSLENAGDILSDLTEMTVEMRVRTEDAGTNWAFFAAPDDNEPVYLKEHYLSILLNDNVEIRRFGGGRSYILSKTWTTGEWHTIKVVFEKNNTILFVDGDPIMEQTNNYSLADCFGTKQENGTYDYTNSVLWFGRSSWLNGTDYQGFNGCIDEIKIYGSAEYDAINTQDHIITRGVADPKNTTVNMFDYWITGQTDNDYRTVPDWDTFFSGINENHLFLFGGSDASGNINTNSSGDLGRWNIYANGSYPYQGIVNKTLVNGYPQLALDQWLQNDADFPLQLPAITYNDEKYTKESLAYLFDPDNPQAGKASYPNVTGLFRVDKDGYYYFRSQETFAELNVDQELQPKESKTGNHITLYDAPWMFEKHGQFFPFNDWSDMFYIDLTDSGKAIQDYVQGGAANDYPMVQQNGTNEPLNHYFGMTIETKFQQPTNGKFDYSTQEPAPMTFAFSGDDDVWIFIDDVLVSDIGGFHNRVRITIDFSTGEITYYTALDDEGGGGTEYSPTNLRDMFEEAGKSDVAWKTVSDGTDTYYIFPDNSLHTLKFFYLERGNSASNCSISFNLQEPLVDSIRKVDENGSPLAGAKFELYNAAVKAGVTVGDNEWWHTASEFEKNGNVITTTESASDGYALLTDEKDDPLTFTSGNYYILEETETPEGYRSNPPIVLQYHGDSETFTVLNKYEVGAYASFTTHWTKAGEFYYAEYNPSSGKVTQSNNKANDTNRDELANGLAIVVPVIKQTTGVGATGDFQRWLPMYGSNTKGWNTIVNSYQGTTAGNNTQEQFEKDLALAAFLQIADNDYQDWYLKWTDGADMLEGYMENLPGDASRYGTNGDLDLVTLFIPDEVLNKLGVTGRYADAQECYEALQKALQEALNNHTEEAAKKFLDDTYTGIGTNQGFRLLYTDNFQQNRGTVIYVTNKQRELRVSKVAQDVDGSEIYLNGAVFAIFDTAEHAAAANTNYRSANDAMTGLKNAVGVQSYGQTASTKINDTLTQDGLLIFRENVPDTIEPDGYAQIIWPSSRTAVGSTDTTDNIFWMKEIYAPEGYTLNEYLIRIEADDTAIYANATGYQYVGGQNGTSGRATMLAEGTEDNITVQADLGKLSQTLTKYAIGNYVDVTLQDITITKQTQSGDSNGAMLTTGDNIWTEDTESAFDLHYGMNVDALTGQYGPHSATATIPTFTAEDGYIRVMPRQNQDLSQYGQHDTTTKKDDLTNNGTAIPLDGLFDLMNTVVVTDELLPGDLKVSKIVEGTGGETDKEFTFTVSLDDKTINGTYGDMVFKNGEATIKLKHGESKIAVGLPAGTNYAVEEAENKDYTVTKSGDTGTIESQKTSEAVFTNTRDMDEAEDNPITTSLTVKKVWEDNDSVDRPRAVTVQLYRAGESYGEIVTLSAANDWCYTWDNLDSSYTWTVTEVNVPVGYDMSVSNKGNSWIITNRKNDPENPPKDTPLMGDFSNISTWLLLLGVSLLGFTLLFLTTKKRGKHLK